MAICPAATRVKRNFQNHSIRCQRPEGHEGAHEAGGEPGVRLTLWYGAVQTLPGDTRYRYEKIRPLPVSAFAGGRDTGSHYE